jgi:hypothetical protein
MLDEPTPTPPATLQPALQDAEQLLRESISEVCSTDLGRADTGEMIRLDEMLAIAGDAAKRAVSLRRRMRQEGRPTPRGTKAQRRRSTPTSGLAPAPMADSAASGKAADAEANELAPSDAGSETRRPADAAAPAASPTLEAGEEHRTFQDTHGVTWSVWAVHPQHGGRRGGLPGTYVHGWLAFVCEAEKRRLSPVPEGWMGVDDAELERLCGTAEVAKTEVTRRMPPVE